MIDLHCHILPQLDDGARDLADSVEMARQAQEDGIRLVCATPHIHPDHMVLPEELEGRAQVVNEELDRQGIDVWVVAAGEVAEPMLGGCWSSRVPARSGRSSRTRSCASRHAAFAPSSHIPSAIQESTFTIA